MIMPPRHRCGVEPIQMETGRFENLNIEKLVLFCQFIETEIHVIFDCVVYEDIS